ncbi:MAG TPA: ElyC/SanA/YdcF family protein [Chitinispirillaceae bacterium]|nr:ElyC/SanA/YdcF family protein [Chitinispirillaceae bacterium]
MSMFKFHKSFGIALIFFLLTLILCLFMFINAGRWLVISDPLPENLDLIFTFAGEHERVAYSKELTSKYPRSFWMLSDYKNGYARLLRKSNFNMSIVQIVDTCKNTVSEVNALRTWLKNNKQFQNNTRLSIGLVSSPYHMRRIKLITKKEFKKSNIDFHFLPVPLDRYNWTSKMLQYWWNTGAVSRVVISELQKIIYFLLIY